VQLLLAEVEILIMIKNLKQLYVGIVVLSILLIIDKMSLFLVNRKVYKYRYIKYILGDKKPNET